MHIMSGGCTAWATSALSQRSAQGLYVRGVQLLIMIPPVNKHSHEYASIYQDPRFNCPRVSLRVLMSMRY